jgi:orotate phosphoribosyltransferase
MTEAEDKLLLLLKERSLKRGTFRLASGDTSSFYLDGKMIQVHSRGAHLIGEVLYEHTKDLDFDAIGGLEVGAVPMTAAAVISYHHHGRSLEGFWVRDKAKAHGTRKLVEGKLHEGQRVVIVDDVVTRGSSALKAIDAVREMRCEVVLAIALVDRLCGAEELMKARGVPYRSVFTIEHLGITPDVPRQGVVAS